MNSNSISFKPSKLTAWVVLMLTSFTMLTGYIVVDVMAPLKTMLEMQLGWDSSDYGLFLSGYGWLNIFLFMLIIGGMILDKKGSRYTGLLAIFLMLGGTLIKYWAISTDFGSAVTTWSIGNWHIFSIKSQVWYATVGFAIFAAGCEMISITATKIVIKWFQGGSVALAMGINIGLGRIGTAIAMFMPLPYARLVGNVSAPVALCLVLLCIGLLTFLYYCVLDRRFDRQHQAADSSADHQENQEEQFRLSDILKIAKIPAFWYVTCLCVLFYSAVFPFLKFATELMILKFHISPDFAGAIPALLPFGNILLTPLFGTIYDKKGHGATIMIIGSVLLIVVHLLLAIPMLNSPWIAVVLMLVLGAAFSLVPSAMWPSVPKIIPFRMLGTAYSMIFWIQTWGVAFIPLIVGVVLQDYCIVGTYNDCGQNITMYDYTIPMLIFALCGILSLGFALLLRYEDKRKGYGLQKPNIVTPK